MKGVNIAITAASYSGNKGAAAMLQSSVQQLHGIYGERLNINLMSVYPGEDREQLPFDYIKVIPCKPEKLLFIAFPLAILYKLLGWIPFLGMLFCKNKILHAYKNTDLVLDEAGISFVDSRGFVMNAYAFVCAAVPLLLGVPVVKYSQAMGSFKSFSNRFLAKWILPKLKLICARGQGTLENLKAIGIEENVKLCADGAFTMPDSERCTKMVAEVCEKDVFYNENVVGLSISSVVRKKCEKLGIDYENAMVEFIGYLTGEGYNVLLIANAARINSEKSRNNDLLICDSVYQKYEERKLGSEAKGELRWYHKEMEAEEIRAYIGRCRFLVASRFHAMIGALEQKVPVLLIGWSHKYQEVLDMFELGQYAIDFSNLQTESLRKEFQGFVKEEADIHARIEKNYNKVIESSKDNIRYVSGIIDELLEAGTGSRVKKSNKKKLMRVVKIGFLMLVAFFLIKYFYTNMDDIKDLDISIDWPVFIVSMLFYFLYKFAQASLWHYITKLNKSSIKYSKAITGYLYSILGKYIPGKVFMLAARVPAYEEEGVPMRKVTICFLIENVCTLLGAAFLFIISLFFFPNDLLKDYMIWAILLVIVFFIVINPKIINFFLRIVGKVIKKTDMEIPITYFEMIKVVVLFIINWLIVGTGFYMLVCSIYPVPVSEMLYTGGVYGLSAIIGILSIFAPSGIGVREGIMILGLSLIMQNGYAVIISIVSRLWQTIAELILILLAFIVNSIKKVNDKKKTAK